MSLFNIFKKREEKKGMNNKENQKEGMLNIVNGLRWKNEEIETCIKLYKQGYKLPEIVEILNEKYHQHGQKRSYASVNKKLGRIRKKDNGSQSRKRRWSEEEENDCMLYLKQGYNYEEVAKKLNERYKSKRTKSCVEYRAVKLRKIHKELREIHVYRDKEWLLQKIEKEGMKISEIAEKCGVSYSAIYFNYKKFKENNKKERNENNKMRNLDILKGTNDFIEKVVEQNPNINKEITSWVKGKIRNIDEAARQDIARHVKELNDTIEEYKNKIEEVNKPIRQISVFAIESKKENLEHINKKILGLMTEIKKEYPKIKIKLLNYEPDEVTVRNEKGQFKKIDWEETSE